MNKIDKVTKSIKKVNNVTNKGKNIVNKGKEVANKSKNIVNKTKDIADQRKNVTDVDSTNSKKKSTLKSKKKFKLWQKGIGVVAAVAAVETIVTCYFYRRTMIRNKADVKRTIKMAGTDWSQYSEIIAKRKEFMLASPHEDIYQTAFDGLKLHGVYFPPIKETKDGKKKFVICFHGYTSQGLKDFIGLTDYYFRNGFAMLHPDARAHT